jgi:hypothetical protein
LQPKEVSDESIVHSFPVFIRIFVSSGNAYSPDRRLAVFGGFSSGIGSLASVFFYIEIDLSHHIRF